VTTRDILNTFFYYRWTVVSVFFTVFILGSIVAFVLPPTYKAGASLLALFAGYYDQSDRTTGGTTQQFQTGQLISVEAQILSSRELHRAVVMKELDPKASSAEIDRALQHFESNFRIEKVDLANTINVSYVDTNPQRAADTLNRLLTEYFHERAGVFTSGRVAFLTTQRDKIKAQLNKANAELISFQQAHGIVNADAQIQSAVALNGLLVQRKLENDNTLAQDRATLASLLSEAKNVPSTILLYVDNTEAAHAVDTMQLALLQLQARRADLASRYLPGSAFVQQLDKQISDMRKSIERQKDHLLNSSRSGHNTYYDTVQDRIVRLTSDIAGEASRQKTIDNQLKASLDKLNDLIQVANQLRRMDIDRDLLTSSFQNFSRQVEQARIDQNQADTVSSTNVRIIQAPFVPTRRDNPPALFVGGSFLAALLIAGLTVLVLSSLRETFISPEEIERSMALPVLSAPISRMTPPSPMDRFRGRRPGSWGNLRDNLARYLPWLKPRQPAIFQTALQLGTGGTGKRARTEYGRMISAIDNSSDGASKVVLMLSFRGDDGLLPIVQGLAMELERRSNKPILVVDMASAGDNALYGRPDEHGRLSWPSGEDIAPNGFNVGSMPETVASQEVLTFQPVGHHHIVVARPKPDAFLPAGRQSAALFDELRQAHDYILIHAAPASQAFTGIENAILADATVLAIRAEATRKPVAVTLRSQILDAGGKVVGIAMTHRSSYIPAFIYRFL
jgi:uncharacterized protein involved in exopolysaccharide biosynthesis